ncbi:hypothetical protein AB1K83_02980 [Sporosarcina sp. 179-K 3D1 HS]|uniref:hypothetical protein n=1 Tax=Sporosarcina sp. 179-K 3D1 HS TaxID=3232169 RepID=UPI00399F091C
MTPNMNTNSNANKKKDDPNTYTAYGDPVKSSAPPINHKFKKATSTIAESTEKGNTRND